MTSANGQMWIIFVVLTTFLSQTECSNCTHELTAYSKKSSLNSDSQRKQGCKWIISVTVPSEFLTIELGLVRRFCLAKTIQVYEDVGETRLLSKTCSPLSWTSLTRKIVVLARSTLAAQEISFKYWRGNYTDVIGEEEIPGSFTFPSPGTAFASGFNCWWHIRGAENSVIGLFFSPMDVNCYGNVINVFEGNTNVSTPVRIFCGHSDRSYLSRFSNVNIQLKTTTNLGNGFTLKYLARVNSGCGHEVLLEVKSHWITLTPFSTYYDHLHCQWKFYSVLSDYVIKMNINIHNIVGTRVESVCTGDYLQVFDGETDQSKSLGRTCGQNLQVEYTSSGQYLLLLFVTDSYETSDGFTVKYKTEKKRSSSNSQDILVPVCVVVSVVTIIVVVVCIVRCKRRRYARERARTRASTPSSAGTTQNDTSPRVDESTPFDRPPSYSKISQNHERNTGVGDNTAPPTYEEAVAKEMTEFPVVMPSAPLMPSAPAMPSAPTY